jgi:hypothetical protein
VSMGGRQASASRVQPAVVVLYGRRRPQSPSVLARPQVCADRTDGVWRRAVSCRSCVVFLVSSCVQC